MWNHHACLPFEQECGFEAAWEEGGLVGTGVEMGKNGRGSGTSGGGTGALGWPFSSPCNAHGDPLIGTSYQAKLVLAAFVSSCCVPNLLLPLSHSTKKSIAVGVA